ncbi:MAG: hypothetical protein R3D86_02285 [Emcibacteraceae bacterium]
MKMKIQIFPLMLLAFIAIFGFKSYDFAMGLDSSAQKSSLNQQTNNVAERLNRIASAAGQETEAGMSGEQGDAQANLGQSGFPYTGEEIQLLQRLAERREELDQRARDMDVREKLLIATEKGIDKKIETLKNIEAQIKALIEIHDEQEKAQIESLVKTYTAMKPKDAAKIFNTLDMDILIPIIEKMNPKVVANILADMNTASANDITVELATRKKLPEIEG